MFSKACEYAIRATIYVAVLSLKGKRPSLKAIAKEIDSPLAFTAKIMQQLVRNDIIFSVMGPTGGFQMTEDNIESVKLCDIVKVIDGDSIYQKCGLGLAKCDALHPCPLHDQFLMIRQDLKDMLEKTNILYLAKELDSGLTFLKE